jgi:hypothetical protein
VTFRSSAGEKSVQSGTRTRTRLFDFTPFPYLDLIDPATFLPDMPLAAYQGLRATP